jgi:hypothetical protein
MPERVRKPASKLVKSTSSRLTSATSSRRTVGSKSTDQGGAISKQARVIAMLQSPGGTSIAAMMQQTGWQQHSVRGFLAGVVRKRLKLNLVSEVNAGVRTYRITGEPAAPSSKVQGAQSKS